MSTYRRDRPWAGPVGFWTTDAPVTESMVQDDLQRLMPFSDPPEGVVIRSAEVYVNGRLWYWKEAPKVDMGKVGPW